MSDKPAHLAFGRLALTLDARREIARAVHEHLSPELDDVRIGIALIGAAIELLGKAGGMDAVPLMLRDAADAIEQPALSH